ncbi:MAG: hypothetical protein AB7F64_08475, partial [Gammaproteobacteria bacterium]
MRTAAHEGLPFKFYDKVIDYFKDRELICDKKNIHELMELYEYINDPKQIGAFLREELGKLHYFLEINSSIELYDSSKHMTTQTNAFKDALNILDSIRTKIENEKNVPEKTILKNGLEYIKNIVSMRSNA